MKRISTLLLKFLFLLIVIAVLVGMIKFPQIEGRAANLDLFSIYSDPFILYIYISSAPFFIGLYQAFKLLNLIETNKELSQRAVNTLGNIKLASLSLIASITLALIYIRTLAHGDDPAGPTAVGILAFFVFTTAAIAAAIFQRRIQNAIKI